MVDNNINSYNKTPYNQVNAGFNGAVPANPLQDSAMGQAVSRPVKDMGEPKEIAKWGGAIAAGAGVSFAIDKTVDAFCKAPNGNYTESLIYRGGSKIDKVVKNSFLQRIEDKFADLTKAVSKKHEGWKASSKKYAEVSKVMKEGANRESMLAFPSAEKHSARELSGLIEKLTPEKLVQLGIQEGEKAKYVEALKNMAPADKTLVSRIVENINKGGAEGLADASKLKIHANKLELIQKYLSGEGKASFLSKVMGRFGIGTGNVIGGGGFGIAMNGLFIGMSIKSAIDAPKGEKTSTLMEDLLANWVGGFLLMIPAAHLIKGVGGWKNLGMSDEARTKVTELAKDLYNKTNGVTKKSYKVEMKAIAKEAKAGLNFGQKAMRLVGKLFSIGHDPVVKVGEAWAKKGTQGWFKPFMKAVGKSARVGIPGGIVRMAAVMLMIQPFTNVFKAISHKLFGKPTPPEELEKAKQAQEAANTQPNPVAPAVVAQDVTPNAAPATETSSDDQNRYIPSAEPSVFATQQNSTVTNALNKSDSMMKYFNDVLKSSH